MTDQNAILMGRIKYKDLLPDLQKNLDKLVWSLNGFISELINLGETIPKLVVSSGYRSPDLNKNIGGAKQSYHMRCLAVDFADDKAQTLGKLFCKYPDLLRKYGLFIESLEHTKGWVHVDMGNRPDRPSRTFNP